MANTNLLDLPTEILDQVYAYLDWDPTCSLTPLKPNIVNISLTCRHLRGTILPVLFRDVKLRLCWWDGALIEPALFRIRRDRPDLAKHIRCIYLRTEFGHFKRPEWKTRSVFAVPEHLNDWTNPSSSCAGSSDRDTSETYRANVNEAAQSLLQDSQLAALAENCSTEKRSTAESLLRSLIQETQRPTRGEKRPYGSLRVDPEEDYPYEVAREGALTSASTQGNRTQRLEHRHLRLRLDALALVMLCIPPSVTAIVFETLPSDSHDNPQSVFALHIAAMVIRIFGSRLQRMTAITSEYARCHRGSSGRAGSSALTDSITDVLDKEVLDKLSRLEFVRFASNSEYGRGHAGMPELWRLDRFAAEPWHTSTLCTALRRLELWNTACEYTKLIPFIDGFTSLESLALNRVELREEQRQFRPPVSTQQSMLWLIFLMELRRSMPAVKFILGDLYTAWPDLLPKSAIRWFQEAAVPTGCNVGYDRETRLLEDFKSFIPLWSAEDSIRGKQAKEARKDGKLVDMAMANRWQTFKDQRKIDWSGLD